jgi:hypothetical protein
MTAASCAVSNRDGRDRVGAAVEHRHLVEHDDRLDDGHDIFLALQAELAQVHLASQQHKHPGARLALGKNCRASWKAPDPPSRHDRFASGSRPAAEMLDAAQLPDKILR